MGERENGRNGEEKLRFRIADHEKALRSSARDLGIAVL
jgi:hypothetical protein